MEILAIIGVFFLCKKAVELFKSEEIVDDSDIFIGELPKPQKISKEDQELLSKIWERTDSLGYTDSGELKY